MIVITTDGSREEVCFDKISHKLKSLCEGLDTNELDIGLIAQKTVEGLHDGISTREIDKFSSEVCAGLATEHPDYSMLGGRVLISRLHKHTKDSFREYYIEMYKEGLIPDDMLALADYYKKDIEENIDYRLDYSYDFFAYRTLEKSYLLRRNGEVFERPQQLLMRVALGVHMDDIDSAIKSYKLMSQKYYTHASPTLFNAGTRQNQMSSCFLVAMKEDSLDAIYDTLKECALISKSGAGIGIHIHNIRSEGSYIAGTNGRSNGIIPMLQVFNHTARYVDQGGGKRKGSFAVYLEPWHPEILDFLELRKNHGAEAMRTRDLFTALWIPDLFMKRVEEGGKWSLMCPSQCKGLPDAWGAEFVTLYEAYEAQGKYVRQIDARVLWEKIIEVQIETGTPYMVYKDACNRKSNQQNLGTIKSSNLCTEIIEYSDKDETAVCNLASLSLPHFVKDNSFDFKLFGEVVYNLIKSMNYVIDYNHYPVHTALKSNKKHRPIGLGVQGLADCFMMLRLPFDSEEARQLNKDIFECMYYHAMKGSVDLAKKHGHYESFGGSPLSKGLFQFDLWGASPSNRYDWDSLRKEVMEHGALNSLLIAPMPTASTAQILGNNECFEPYTANLYKRRTLSGEYVILNKHLVLDCIRLGVWNVGVRKQIMANEGSVQNISEIPDEIKALYKTVWEIKQKVLVDMAIDRGPYVCQSQSLNLFMKNPDYSKVTSMHFYAWQNGLKTGIYYLRSTAAVEAQAFTLEHGQKDHLGHIKSQDGIVPSSCEADCISCGS